MAPTRWPLRGSLLATLAATAESASPLALLPLLCWTGVALLVPCGPPLLHHYECRLLLVFAVAAATDEPPAGVGAGDGGGGDSGGRGDGGSGW